MDEVTRTIIYEGPDARAPGLVEMLEREGVRVEWTPPVEERGLGADTHTVILYLVCTGSLATIKAVAKQARERAPWAKIKVEGEDEGPDDGGFMPNTQAGKNPDLR